MRRGYNRSREFFDSVLDRRIYNDAQKFSSKFSDEDIDMALRRASQKIGAFKMPEGIDF